MKTVVVIPARWGSTRLPGKPLLDLCGKPVIQHVYERSLRAESVSDVVVATDDSRIFEAVVAFGGKAVMTSSDHPNGTSRAAEAVRDVECDFVINVQGDEPMIDPRMIDQVAGLLKSSDSPCATLVAPIVNVDEDMGNPNVVKVAMTKTGKALYFSRSPIPFVRCQSSELVFLRHIGIYGYRKDFLPVYVGLEPTPLSEAESLEQLRVLEHGYSMAVAVSEVKDIGVGIDVAEDLEKARRIISGS